MFTLGLFYTIVYLVIFLSLLVVSFFSLPLQVLTNFSTTTFFIFLSKYSKFKTLFLFLIFCLTGLPPVGLFLVKFNIFCFILYQGHFFIILLLFMLFFFNMIYYIQFFNFKNFKLSMYSVITPSILVFWRPSTGQTTQFSTYSTYSVVLFIVNTIFFLLVLILIFNDCFLLINLL